jgi:hypothetical protein
MAIVVCLKEPYYEWARSLEEDSPIDQVEPSERRNVYLVDQRDETKWEKVLRRHYAVIFEAELNEWYTARELWPRKRTWEMFQEWFDAKVVEVVADLSRDCLESD